MCHRRYSKFYANFVSMKERYTSVGFIKLDYKGRVIEVPFTLSLYGYGGLPFIGVQDKNKHNHSFIRGTYDGWHANGAAPRWPKDFLVLLVDAFEKEYIALEASKRNQDRKTCSCPVCREKRENANKVND